MALFKFRKGGEEHAAPPKPPESIEAMRKRALYRLVGSAVLVLAGVIGFPILFDSQPRPIAVDIPVEIPDKNKTRPLTVPAAPAAASVTEAPTALPVAAAPKEPVATPKLEEKEAVALGKQAQLAPKTVAPSEPKAAEKQSDGAKALALLEGKAAEKPVAGGEGRFVVQVGAFSDAARAKEARIKVERAGLKTYTQVVETKEGSRTRVRVGPFADKVEAEHAAQKIKTLDLPAHILSL